MCVDCPSVLDNGGTTAAGSQCMNEGLRVGCPSEAVMDWWTLCRGVKSTTPSRFDALFRFQRFPTHSTLYVEIVLRERGQAIMERRTLCRSPTAGPVADLREADSTRVLLDCTLIGTAFPTLLLHPH